MTWKELMEYISEMSEKQQESSVMVANNEGIDTTFDEVDALLFTKEENKGYPYLVFIV